MSTLKFRNLNTRPDAPVETWPFEGIVTAVERGTLPDWRRLAAAITADPWGNTARQVEEALTIHPRYGVSELLASVIVQARHDAAASDKAEVASEIGRLLAVSGLDRGDFAQRVGTSTSRLSTYLSAQVVPSAALLVRMRRLAVASMADSHWRDDPGGDQSTRAGGERPAPDGPDEKPHPAARIQR